MPQWSANARHYRNGVRVTQHIPLGGRVKPGHDD